MWITFGKGRSCQLNHHFSIVENSAVIMGAKPARWRTKYVGSDSFNSRTGPHQFTREGIRYG